MAKKTGTHTSGANNGNVGNTQNGSSTAVVQSSSNNGDSKSSEDTSN